ncbi:hypothetical protein [Celerinatantimonas sp. MCCC 1A17872]|uniref:hypothetical protein n=1 Tax=Celerinatantimonas sp. MCCC 1A17872 TaxID=3177514 RepID=UPI0038C9ABC1
MSFTAKVWEWDCYDEREKLEKLYRLGFALVFLSTDAAEQKQQVDDCPFCYVWYEHCIHVIEFINVMGEFTEPLLMAKLRALEQSFNGLTADEMLCHTLVIFDTPGWQQIRQQSAELLSLLEWNLLAQYYGELDTFKNCASHND